MFRLSLSLIVALSTSSIAFAQYCPNGCGCRNRPPVGLRLRSIPYWQPNNSFGRPGDYFPSEGESGSDFAPPRPGIDESGFMQLPPGSGAVPPGENINDPEMQPKVPLGPEGAGPEEQNDPLAGIDLHGQRTCPVTGEKLGTMGVPLPVTVKGRTIFVCCKACVAKVQRDPDKYLQKLSTDVKAPAQIAPIIRPSVARQQTCPVTGKKLGSMGPPVAVTVLGRTVSVCCEGCVETMKRDPVKYLKLIDAELKLGKKPMSTENRITPPIPVNRVAPRWGGQKKCPVTGATLGEHGEPIAVRLGERTIFVCCESCMNTVRRNPEKYIRQVDAELGVPQAIHAQGNRTAFLPSQE